jgi:hypothetical protein
MKKRAQDYREGDWFLVPLPSGGYGVGVIARKARSAVLLGYFFGPRLPDVEAEAPIGSLRPQGALLVARFGDHRLFHGDWRSRGRIPNWDRAEWPTPVFGRIDSDGVTAWRCIYDDRNPSKVVREQRTSRDVAERLPEDTMMGADNVAFRLDRALGGAGA